MTTTDTPSKADIIVRILTEASHSPFDDDGIDDTLVPTFTNDSQADRFDGITVTVASQRRVGNGVAWTGVMRDQVAGLAVTIVNEGNGSGNRYDPEQATVDLVEFARELYPTAPEPLDILCAAIETYRTVQADLVAPEPVTTITGSLAANPEIRYTRQGTAIGTIYVNTATGRTKVITTGALAENVALSLTMGHQVVATGEWSPEDGGLSATDVGVSLTEDTVDVHDRRR